MVSRHHGAHPKPDGTKMEISKITDTLYTLYSKDLVGELAVELSLIKLHKGFWKD
jgi:hypothetical protein